MAAGVLGLAQPGLDEERCYSDNGNLPLIVITGPTASGKTALALRLARQYGGEIICADSRTVYRQLAIGTAKPTPAEQNLVPHWGLDLVEPDQTFSAAQFQAYARQVIADIRARGRIPFVVGGTGLYIDGLIFAYQFGPMADPARRAALQALSIEQLQQRCAKDNIQLPHNQRNRRHLVRAIEQGGVTRQRRQRPLPGTVVVGLTTDGRQLRTMIRCRIEHMVTNRVAEEASRVAAQYGWQAPALTGNIYAYVRPHLAGRLSYDQLIAQASRADYRLAKRQLTWLRRNPYIVWGTVAAAEHYLHRRLAVL